MTTEGMCDTVKHCAMVVAELQKQFIVALTALNNNNKHTSSTVRIFSQTFGSWRLQIVSGEAAPADGENVTRVVAAVVVEGPPPAVEGDQHLDAAQGTDRGRTDEVGVLAVHRLQLHAHLEAVLLWGGWLLLGKNERWVETVGQVLSRWLLETLCFSEHVEPCAGTLWNMRDGAISAPFSVFRRNIGQDDALRRKPGEKENCVTGRESHPNHRFP